MKGVTKSAIWALSSVPITLLAFYFGYALAHGSLLLLTILFAPGWLIIITMGESNYPDWALYTIIFCVQYVTYFVVIHGIKKILFKSDAHNK